ncbi:MAG: hypothetical protein ACM3MM_07610 [Acidobacteriota bacterium]
MLTDMVVVVAVLDRSIVDAAATEVVSSRGDASGAESLLLHAPSAVKTEMPMIAPTPRRRPRPDINRCSVMAPSSDDSVDESPVFV